MPCTLTQFNWTTRTHCTNTTYLLSLDTIQCTSTTLHMHNLLHLCTTICCSTNLLLNYNLLHLHIITMYRLHNVYEVEEVKKNENHPHPAPSEMHLAHPMPRPSTFLTTGSDHPFTPELIDGYKTVLTWGPKWYSSTQICIPFPVSSSELHLSPQPRNSRANCQGHRTLRSQAHRTIHSQAL